MYILFITCVYPPEPVVSAVMGSDIAGELVRQGHSVTVLAPFPSKTSGRLYPGYKRALYRKEKLHNTEVIRCWSVLESSSPISKLFENISYGITTSLRFLFMRATVDVVYLNSWPIFATVLVVMVAKLKKVKIIRSIKDLYPETLVAYGLIKKSGAVYGFLDKIERFNFVNSTNNVVLSDRFSEIFQQKGWDQDLISIIPDWNNFEAMDLPEKNPNNSLYSNFSIGFGGNISKAANVEFLIDCFSEGLKYNKKMKMTILGDGPALDQCVKRASELGIANSVEFHRKWKKSETITRLSQFTILVLPTNLGQAAYSVPSKIFSYMKAMRPVFAIGDKGSELESIILQSKGGWINHSYNSAEIGKHLATISQLPITKLQEIGVNGSIFINSRHNRDRNMDQYCQLIVGKDD